MTVAHGKGYVCDHVNFLGLGSFKDWDLMTKIRDGEYTFVTNNGSDFTALYRREQFHAGLVIFIPNVTPARQQEMFRAALVHIGNRELTNSVVEVSIAGGEITCREFDWPPS